MRRCNRCGEEKSLDDFHRHRGHALGRAYTCAECMRGHNRDGHFMRKYGISRLDALALQAERGCEACGATDDLVMDHDHGLVGAFRGVLCDPCNRTLGHAKECADRLRHLADYIEARA